MCCAGTYGPALKLIYADEHPLDPATLTAVRGLIAAGGLMAFGIASKQFASRREEVGRIALNGAIMWNSEADTLRAIKSPPEGPPPTEASSPYIDSAIKSLLMGAVSGSVLMAGLELGLYNFTATSMEAVGLQITSATRAGFITQSCAVLTPMLAFLGVRGCTDPLSPQNLTLANNTKFTINVGF